MTTIDEREAEADRAAAARNLVAAERLLSAITADAPERGETWVKLASVRRMMGDKKGALDAISGALRLDPLAFVPLLMKASLTEAIGDADAADEIYGAALFHCPPEEGLSPVLRQQVAHARERHVAFLARREAALRQAVGDLDRAGDGERRRIERFRTNTLRTSRTWHQQPTHFHFPELPEIEFFDREPFPGLADLEGAYETILGELRGLIASEAAEYVPYIQYPDDVPGQMDALNHSPDWTALHLIAMGERVEANARHCPRTIALYESLDPSRIPRRGPNLMFSLLAPHTRIPPHHGISNARLVMHMPLIVPPNCGFRVGGTTRQWVPGIPFVFDDTIEHEAWNDSDELRIVLIGDLWRPELSPIERHAVAAIIAAADAPARL